jgi:formamidopyrimidine-DNA glycosylase
MSGGARIGYTDPRRFGAMDIATGDVLTSHRLLAGLGPEPLGPDFSADYLHSVLKARHTSIKAALLDQRIVAGLGNIYVCEALHRAGISPHREAGTLAAGRRPGAGLNRLVETIGGVLTEAIAAGGSTLRDHARTDGTLGYFQHSFSVYDRAGETCPTAGCGGTVERTVQSGRSSFWCPRCQH